MNQPTLSKWLRDARTLRNVPERKSEQKVIEECTRLCAKLGILLSLPPIEEPERAN